MRVQVPERCEPPGLLIFWNINLFPLPLSGKLGVWEGNVATAKRRRSVKPFPFGG